MTTILPHHLSLLLANSRNNDATITIQNPPQAIYQLPAGAIIAAEVLADSKDRLSKIDTIFGQLIIKTLFRFSENSKLELQVTRFHPQLQLLLTTIDGKQINLPSLSINTHGPVTAKGQSELASQKSSNDSTRNAVELDIGARIKATLLRPVETAAGNLYKPVNSQIINKLELTLRPNKIHTTSSMEIKKGSETPVKQNTNIYFPPKTIENSFRLLKNFTETIPRKAYLAMRRSANRVKQLLQSPSDITKDRNQGFPGLLQAGSKQILKFHGTDNSLATTSRNGNLNPNFMNSVVVAMTKSEQPILKTPFGMIALDTKVPLQTGVNLVLEILPELIQRATIESPAMRFKHIFRSGEWANLDEAMHQLTITAPSAIKNLQELTLPQPNTKLTSNILFFLSALKIGNIQSWIGNTTAALLGQINPELLSRLDEDFFHISRAMFEPPPNEWRTALIPCLTAIGLEQFQLHTQNHPNKDNSGISDSSRFIVDLTLSRLGRLQLDGFVRKKRKQLDLIVRSQKTLPRIIRIDIGKIFTNFSEISNIKGQLTFQVNQNFVDISMPYMEDQSNKSIII